MWHLISPSLTQLLRQGLGQLGLEWRENHDVICLMLRPTPSKANNYNLHTSILPPPSEPPRSLTAASAKIWKKVQFWAALFASDAKTMVLAFEVITNQQSYTYWTIFIFFIFGVLCSLSKYSLIAHKLERPRSSRGEQPLVACFIVRIVGSSSMDSDLKKKINSRSNQLSY